MASSDGFKFWESYYEALVSLDTDKQRSDFMLGLCAYVFDGEEPTFDDPVVGFGFRLVAEQARQSMEISRAARDGGIKSGKSRREKSKANPVPKGVRKGGSKGGSNVSRLVGTSVPNQPNFSKPAPDTNEQATPPPPTRPAGADAPPPLT